MGWIKRKAAQPKPHDCETPFRRPRVPQGGSGMSPKPGVPMRHVELTPEQKERQESWWNSHKIPVGDPGDIWACEMCGQVWIMYPPPPYRGGGYSPRGNEWKRAGAHAQRKYAPRYTCGCRIDKPQKCTELNGTMHGITFAQVEEWTRPDWVKTGPQYPRPPRGDAGEARDES